VTAYPVNGNGNIAPSVNINGSNPFLFEPEGIALDSKGNIYVANLTGGLSGNGSVTVYAADSNGNATPTATIAGPDTGLSTPVGIALDASGNIYVANVSGPPFVDGGPAGSITEYPAGSNGDTTPMATISNTVFPGMANPTGIAVDQVSGNIFVVSAGGGVSNVVEYTPGSSGTATPIAIITGSNTGLGTTEADSIATFGIALNPVNGDIYVGGNSDGIIPVILVYASGSNGNVEPKAAIEGPDTGLGSSASLGVALDSSGTIYVANEFVVLFGPPETFGTITVYPPGSNGNVTPSATIGGSNAGFSTIYGIAIGP